MGQKKENIRVVTLRCPIGIYDRLAAQAEKETRSISQQVLHYIRKALNEEKNIEQKEEPMYNKYDEKEKKIQRGDG